MWSSTATIKLGVLLEKKNTILIFKIERYFKTLKYQNFDNYSEIEGVIGS